MDNCNFHSTFITPFIGTFLTIFALFIIYKHAPIAHFNVKMSNEQKLKMRNISRLIVLIGSLICFITINYFDISLGISMSEGYGLITLSIFVAKCSR